MASTRVGNHEFRVVTLLRYIPCSYSHRRLFHTRISIRAFPIMLVSCPS